MATTTFFEETVRDQDHKTSFEIELGRSSFYSGCKVASGDGEDSIYLRINGEFLVMDRATAKKFAQGVHGVAN